MTKQVLGRKFVRSSWFFLAFDFLEPTVYMETIQAVFFVSVQSRQTQNLQPKQRIKCEDCHFSQWNYQKKLRRLKFIEISEDLDNLDTET